MIRCQGPSNAGDKDRWIRPEGIKAFSVLRLRKPGIEAEPGDVLAANCSVVTLWDAAGHIFGTVEFKGRLHRVEARSFMVRVAEAGCAYPVGRAFDDA